MKHPLSFDGTKLTVQLPAGAGLIVFDSYCVLCSSVVSFLTKADKYGKLYYTSFDTPTGKALAESIPSEMDSLIFLRNNIIYFQSDAVVGIIESLGYPWKAFSFVKFIPHVFREGLYRYIARIRYKVFGKKKQCALPPPEIRKRFIK
ncbi:MAG TPA: DCC1-like thiol-disulfide oxidoreductase family protein [Lentimicrobium sp.]|nr:DCC1-like thiol-disulfide oxidoreductase family protein [Lentimicrobium sp.]